MPKKHEILLGLTTTTGSNWREKIEEIRKFGIEKIALFPTYLDPEQRKELYLLLEDIGELQIPHVHLRDDFKSEEVSYLIKRFGSERFNIHPQKFYPLQFDLSKYYKNIFVENPGSGMPTDEELEKFGGACVDFSHLENKFLTKNPIYQVFLEKVKKYPVGCCHISAIKKKSSIDKGNLGNPDRAAFDEHFLGELTELDYIKKYQEFLPHYISLELENSFAEQLACKRYLENILGLE